MTVPSAEVTGCTPNLGAFTPVVKYTRVHEQEAAVRRPLRHRASAERGRRAVGVARRAGAGLRPEALLRPAPRAAADEPERPRAAVARARSRRPGAAKAPGTACVRCRVRTHRARAGTGARAPRARPLGQPRTAARGRRGGTERRRAAVRPARHLRSGTGR